MVVLSTSTATSEPTTIATHIATKGTSEREYSGVAIALTVARGADERWTGAGLLGAGLLGGWSCRAGARAAPPRGRATR